MKLNHDLKISVHYLMSNFLLTDRNTTSSNVPGNNSLLSSETSAVSRLPSEDQEEVEEDPGKEFPTTADHFLVCVFNVSSKVSYR